MNKYPSTLLCIWLSGAVALIALSIYVCNGHLIYSLDDPYIHLSVAEKISKGWYGINFGEYSTPSSSMIYPLILAVTQWLGLGSAGALLVNLLAMAGAVYLMGDIFQNHILKMAPGSYPYSLSNIAAIGLGMAFCLVMNAWGLVMTGMEHALHILAVLTVLWGFLKIIDHDAQRIGWLIIAIAALPAIRFEGMAMAIFSTMALIYLGRYKAASITTALLSLIVLAWFCFTKSHGMPLLPSSVMLKSAIAANTIGHRGIGPILASIQGNFEDSIHNRQGRILIAELFIIGCLSLINHSKNENIRLSVVVGGIGFFTGLVHLFFGHYGWFSRYEIYAMTLATLSCLCLGRQYLHNVFISSGCILVLLVVALPYAYTTQLSAQASLNIYQQQYQMHRFAVEYWQRPVAVNDIGLVSYHNPHYVLDLMGLGSEEVRKLKFAGQLNAPGIARIVAQKRVTLIMIYANWFKGDIPPDWRKVAILETSQITAASNQVNFYITPAANLVQVNRLLHQFAKTLPHGAQLLILS
jgi:hypothetical protein